MIINIKKATLDNLTDIQKLNAKLFEHQYKFENDLKLDWPFTDEGYEYFKKLIEKEIVYLAYDVDKLVGYIAGSFDKNIRYLKRKVAEIDNMFIHEEYRGHNIGTILVNKFKEECNKKGIYNYDVSVYCKNTSGIKFYEKNGFDIKTDTTLSCSDKKSI